MKLLPLHSGNAVEISPTSPLVLASTSPYRAAALVRLGVPFVQQAPAVDETPRPGEAPEALARRLALAKARAVAALQPDRWVLGSDQVAFYGDVVMGKPGTPEANVEQLLQLSGREVRFATALALTTAGGLDLTAMDVTVVQFRRLDRASVQRYLAREPAHDCAGGFKIEGLGISLFESVESRDPSALVGLPLIALRRLLDQVGFAIP